MEKKKIWNITMDLKNQNWKIKVLRNKAQMLKKGQKSCMIQMD